ncbi:hypothetical protein QUC31_007593 [Theobroma cacao]
MVMVTKTMMWPLRWVVVVVVTGKLGMGGSRACAEVVSPVSPPYGHTSHVSVWVLESDVILTISQGSLILSRDFLGSEFAMFAHIKCGFRTLDSRVRCGGWGGGGNLGEGFDVVLLGILIFAMLGHLGVEHWGLSFINLATRRGQGMRLDHHWSWSSTVLLVWPNPATADRAGEITEPEKPDQSKVWPRALTGTLPNKFSKQEGPDSSRHSHSTTFPDHLKDIVDYSEAKNQVLYFVNSNVPLRVY